MSQETPLSITMTAETYQTQYGRLSGARLLEAEVGGAVAEGAAMLVTLQVEGEAQAIQMRGQLQRLRGTFGTIKLSLGLAERRQLEDVFRRVKGGSLPRVEPRYPTVFEASIDGSSRLDYVHNIGKGGIFIATANAPALNTHVKVKLKLPTSPAPLEVEAKVVWRGVEQETGRNGFGAQFVNTSPDVAMKITDFISAVKARAGKHALVADDDATTRQVLVDLLEAQGFSVVQADDGLKAKTLIEEHVAHLHLVVLDLQMPVMDGFDVLTRVRELTRKHNVPIIVVTGTDLQRAAAAIELGADDAVLKGFSGDEFLALIENVLAQKV